MRFVELVRFLSLVAAAFLLAEFVPPLSVQESSGTIVDIMVLFGFLAGFLINRALERRQKISSGILVELSRLRRLKHLSENISDQGWAKQFQRALSVYHQEIADGDSVHAVGSDGFRDVTHRIYQFTPKTKRDALLVADLLETTRELALERERIEQAMATKLPWYSWSAVGTAATFAVTLFLMNRDQPHFPRITVAFAIACVLLTFDLLIRTDHISRAELTHFQELYRKNLKGS